MSLTPDRFAEFAAAVYGRDPFPWQVRLAERLAAGGTWPRAVALPTAAGKTTCIDIALFALACGATGAARRVFFVVDRRVVVDQAKTHAEELRDTLDAADGGAVREVADRLRDLARPGWLALAGADRNRVLTKRRQFASEKDSKVQQKLLDQFDAVEREWFGVRPLDVFALRGGLYRETAWARSPLQPTVLASTVDQVGSRLLFRGYGVSPNMAPVHAGLVGNDALILLDEAHCAKPFGQTMRRVEDYRGRFRTAGDPTPFAFAELTATPTGEVAPEEMFKLDETIEGMDLSATDDPKKSPRGKLYRRMSAAKPAKLVVSGEPAASPAKPGSQDDKKRRKQLVATLAEQARGLLTPEHRAVGVIVNRVATARELAAELKTAAKGVEPPDVILLTGRMRPVDRDAIMDRIEPLMSGSKLSPEKPTVVVATQCLEVGADLDFHALVTECASLDALRQRFGRLNRVAARDSAPAVVVIRGDQTADTETDPVYREALALTWQWLNGNAPDGVFDFGVLAVNRLVNALPAGGLAPLCAPTDDAAVLLPACLDGWVQTSPPPTPDRDIAPYLHGPKRGVPDVSVVFRNDLGDAPQRWAEVVELCPPSSAEALPVKISVFKQWLAGTLRAETDDTSDAEEAAPDEPKRGDEPEPAGRAALRWRGPDDSEVIGDPRDLRPGDTLVLRCTDADVHLLGDFPTLPPADCGDAASRVARDKAVLRLPESTLSREVEEFDERLTAEVEAALPAGLSERVAEKVKRDFTHKSRRVARPYPDGMAGWVVTGRRRLHENDPEYLDDVASSGSPNLQPVTLEAHSAGVAARAERFAGGCGLDPTLYRRAGLFHDIGKLDPRFQGWLLGGRRRGLGDPLAKSGPAGGNRADRRAARERSGYPAGGRHEALSAALLRAKTGDDLLLHLIATHHGAARPFVYPPAETAAEPLPMAPPPLFGVSFTTDDCRQRPAEWNPAFAERFWRVVRRYGWWGSAYREAVFRLADQSQSAAEQEEGWTPGDIPASAGDLPPPAPAPELVPLPLPGLDGANPLAFLAALGALRLADKAYNGRAKLSWHRGGRWTPTLHLPAGVTAETLAEKLLAAAPAGRRVLTVTPDLRFVPASLLVEQVFASVTQQCEYGDFLTAFADPNTISDESGSTHRTAFYLMKGKQVMINAANCLVEVATTSHLERTLFVAWDYSDPSNVLSMRWDPRDDSRHAYRYRDPSKQSERRRGSMIGANRLAFEALPLFPCVPRFGKLQTTGFARHARRDYWTWPLWSSPATVDVARSLMALRPLAEEFPRRDGVCGYGVVQCVRSERVANGDYSNFAPATTG